ncbi:MAG TPA: 50S ribosomal protein L32 [Candidatus Moranbacteria bacterium]|nr:50S ribosomal protein L32 [Candidatus Moranbacteria bacterium]
MAVPKQRQNKARKGRRRAGQLNKNNIAKAQTVKCSNCGARILSHRVCPKCGFYKGKEVIKMKEKKSTKKK